LGEGASEIDDGPSRIDGDAGEEREVFAAMGVSCEMGDRRMRQENERQRWDLSTIAVRAKLSQLSRCSKYFSSSRSFSTSKVSSHPTSISTLTPPSSSSSDCDAVDSERAPWSGQKLNMSAI